MSGTRRPDASVLTTLAFVVQVAGVAPALAQERTCKSCGADASTGETLFQGRLCQNCAGKCTECGFFAPAGQRSPIWANKDRFCKTCYAKCASCGAPLEKPGGSRTCEVCLNKCKDCSAYVPAREKKEGKCSSCWEKSARRCDFCGKIVADQFVHWVDESRGLFWCGGCSRKVEPRKHGVGPSSDAPPPTPATPAPSPHVTKQTAKTESRVHRALVGMGAVVAGLLILFFLFRPPSRGR